MCGPGWLTQSNFFTPHPHKHHVSCVLQTHSLGKVSSPHGPFRPACLGPPCTAFTPGPHKYRHHFCGSIWTFWGNNTSRCGWVETVTNVPYCYFLSFDVSILPFEINTEKFIEAEIISTSKRKGNYGKEFHCFWKKVVKKQEWIPLLTRCPAVHTHLTPPELSPVWSKDTH